MSTTNLYKVNLASQNHPGHNGDGNDSEISHDDAPIFGNDLENLSGSIILYKW